MPAIFRTILTACVALTAISAAADTYRATNRMPVVALDGNRFEVIGPGDLGARDYWCAAADYADRVLRAPGNVRIYVARGYATSQTAAPRKSVTFTLDPTGLQPRDALILGRSIRDPGANLALFHARTFCNDSKLLRG